MLSNKEIMDKAREALRGKWGLTIGASFICYLLIVACTFLDVPVDHIQFSNPFYKLPFLLICGAVIILIPSPLMAGLYFFFYNIALKRDARLSDLFCNFRYKYWRTILVNLIANIPNIIVGVILGFVIVFTNPDYVDSIFASPIAILVSALLYTIYLLVWYIFYEISFCILSTNLKLNAIGVIIHSIQLMKANLGRYLGLLARFTGWYLLCIITCGIAYIWIHSYSSTSLMLLYREMEKKYSQDYSDEAA